MSHGTKNRRFWPELSVSGLLLQFEFINGLEMMHKALCRVEELPYNFSRPSIKFEGHTGRKIDDLNQILVRLLGRSQLSNPSDLPCLNDCPYVQCRFPTNNVNFIFHHLSKWNLKYTAHHHDYVNFHKTVFPRGGIPVIMMRWSSERLIFLLLLSDNLRCCYKKGACSLRNARGRIVHSISI